MGCPEFKVSATDASSFTLEDVSRYGNSSNVDVRYSVIPTNVSHTVFVKVYDSGAAGHNCAVNSGEEVLNPVPDPSNPGTFSFSVDASCDPSNPTRKVVVWVQFHTFQCDTKNLDDTGVCPIP